MSLLDHTKAPIDNFHRHEQLLPVLEIRKDVWTEEGKLTGKTPHRLDGNRLPAEDMLVSKDLLRTPSTDAIYLSWL